MVNRPSFCPDENCCPVTNYADMICGGLLDREIPHDDLKDNMSLCFGETRFFVNAQDCYYLKRIVMALDAQNTKEHGYVPPGRGETWEICSST